MPHYRAISIKNKDTSAIIRAIMLAFGFVYSFEDASEITIANSDEIRGCVRYSDLTTQSIILDETIRVIPSKDMPEKLLFIQLYSFIKIKNFPKRTRVDF